MYVLSLLWWPTAAKFWSEYRFLYELLYEILPLCFKVLDCFCASNGSGLSHRLSNLINFKRLTMKPAQDCPPALCISYSDIYALFSILSVFIFNIRIQYLITWLHMKANIGSLPSLAFTAKFEALLDTPTTYLQNLLLICSKGALCSWFGLWKSCIKSDAHASHHYCVHHSCVI